MREILDAAVLLFRELAMFGWKEPEGEEPAVLALNLERVDCDVALLDA